jgi:hypothetical protein
MLERVKMSAAFAFLLPGPKMMWQFDELGYDIDINFNERIGRKPLPWGEESLGYYDNPLRQYVYQAYKGIIHLRNALTPQALEIASTNHKLTGVTRRLVFDLEKTDLIVLGNFGISESNLDPAFTEPGKWYDYFSGDSIMIVNTNEAISLAPGEWHIFTNQKLSAGFPNVVATYQDPVTINPTSFTVDNEITITFDASRADPDGTSGLLTAEKVYMHAGIVTSDFNNADWTYTKGNFNDDGLGQMTKVEGSEQLWQITITPKNYFGLAEGERAYRLGMYFRDAQNENLGKGFRGKIIYRNVDDEQPFITISPSPFEADTEITITFNAAKGNKELVGANKVYLHSGIISVDTENPQNADWIGVVGNWGKDDGIGEMTKTSSDGELWQIRLTPKTYYNLTNGQHPFWIGAAFRSADGNIKASADPSVPLNGIAMSNGDFFLQNSGVVSINEREELPFDIYPNPTNGIINLAKFPENSQIRLFDITGKLVYNNKISTSKMIDISHLPKGIYVYNLRAIAGYKAGKIILID